VATRRLERQSQQHHSIRRKETGRKLQRAARPGAGSADIRQQLGHLANFNYLWCSQAKGEKNPNADTNLDKLTTKAEFIKALNSAFSYCEGVYGALTDASGTDVDADQRNRSTGFGTAPAAHSLRSNCSR
jgi:uncharacterized damage-inducible protein DinB